MASIKVENLQIGYGNTIIVEDLNITIPKGKISTIIGPNGCGKSTVLNTMARIIKQKSGVVSLDGKAVHKQSTEEVARIMAILPQDPKAMEGLTVRDLVSFGRFPYQKGFGKLRKEDEEMIDWALSATGMSEFSIRSIHDLSGGQRQRVWIALALAQGTDLLLLDEPTTFLDLAHQLEILELLKKLNEEEGKTIVMVIHDLNQAARFAHYMIALKDGSLIKTGTPYEIMTPAVLREVFSIEAKIVNDPRTNKPSCFSYNLLNKESATKVEKVAVTT
ncbi:ABC transporter ATP-binding protein [Bacillus sp. P14.5]|uniref:ABC transporter ATP-binding protein n=1 Tax=Bacillus sp. P14.5 TaxID=1983400 RepID=UPI000DE9546C|nr:ABC transporter ATP-binding protein [Bacillus sp. P14.5]